MSNITEFVFNNITLDVQVENDNVWFLANTVCEILGYENPRKAIADHTHDEDVTKRYGLSKDGKQREMTYINESGLYALIFGSRLEGAKEFKRWVTSEVLPSIRQHGFYGTPQTIDEFLNDPDFAIQALQKYKFEREQRLLAEKQRDDAIKTKAWIGSKREATAMNTASRLSRENEILLTEIGNSKTYKTVKAIPWLKNYFALSKGTYIQIGRKLSALSERMGVKTLQIEDSNYGEVKGYHVSVINKFKELVDSDNTYLNKYRLAD